MAVSLTVPLADAYYALGIPKVKDIDLRVREAQAYLKNDREHYIEAAEPEVPEYRISISHGVICKLIPLAQKITTEQQEDHILQNVTVLSLMVTETETRYVLSNTRNRLFDDPAECGYSYPIYRYCPLENIPKDLQVLPPQEIRPAATPMDWEIFGMIFTAMAHFSGDLAINYIPHKTERAMLTVQHAPMQEITLNGQTVSCKLIPLAGDCSLWEEMREDHRYSYTKELCLMLSDGAPQYVLRIHHAYYYFRKVISDDVPGGCSYEPTGEKQEITYHTVTLQDIRDDLNPMYY